MNDQRGAFSSLLRALRAHRYSFITPTPATHARVIARRSRAENLRDVLGWSLPFSADVLSEEMLTLMQSAEIVETDGALLRSRVRVSSLDDLLFLHSAYPTTQPDSVFFGPDSYRFARFLQHCVPALPAPKRVVDLGCGAGVGGIVAARLCPTAKLTLSDINPRALTLARVNSADAGVEAEAVESDALQCVEGDIDLVIANPPYIADAAHRAYRDGGAMHGGAVSLAWARAAAERLRPGGALVLYTGSAIVNGEDALRTALSAALAGFDIRCSELDPDVFGEELEREDYAGVERIAVLGLVAIKR